MHTAVCARCGQLAIRALPDGCYSVTPSRLCADSGSTSLGNKRGITFVLAGFGPRGAMMALVSNQEDGKGKRLFPVVDDFHAVFFRRNALPMRKLDIKKVDPEICRLLGRLKYRTSYGQNVLEHSIEVAHLTAMMAAELGLDRRLALRSGLLHDIGKAIDYEREGTHPEIGEEVARKYGEPEVVVNAIASHHEDVEVGREACPRGQVSRQNLPQSKNCPPVPHRSSRVTQTQTLRCFAVRHVLKVSHQNHLPVIGF